MAILAGRSRVACPGNAHALAALWPRTRILVASEVEPASPKTLFG